MLNLEFKNIKFKLKQSKSLEMLILIFLFSWLNSFAQVKSSIDTTKIKIGEQITFRVEVETDSTKLVLFPEGPSFSPLEVIESYAIDTIKTSDRIKLIKKYGLTQFDSGTYYIPRQKVLIANNVFHTDSLIVEVNNIVVDTTKQGLYGIKPIIEVEKPQSHWIKYLLIAFGILALVGFLLYWFIWRPKPLTEEEKIALLPPYDRAKLALKKLDESKYLENQQLKSYYSELTFAIRNYLDEKVYDKALESTTDELIARLEILREGHQFELSSETIRNIESILKRADLVKFAKSAPDVELAKMDRSTVDVEIDHVREVLPEASEEEKLLDEQYRLKLERKKKKRKVVLTSVIVLVLLIMTYVGLGVKYGFVYVKDTLIGHQGKELLESTWVTSDYGYPPITISTPEVLERKEKLQKDDLNDQAKISSFIFEKPGILTIEIHSEMKKTKDSINVLDAIESGLKNLETKRAKNIITQDEKFVTPNGAEGVKTFGKMDLPIKDTESFFDANYAIYTFTDGQQVLQQIMFVWRQDDEYLEKALERMQNSIELQPKTE